MFAVATEARPTLRYDVAEVAAEFSHYHCFGAGGSGDLVRAYEFVSEVASLVGTEVPFSREFSVEVFLDWLGDLEALGPVPGSVFEAGHDILNVMVRDPNVPSDLRRRLVYHPNVDVALSALAAEDDPYVMAEVLYDTDHLVFDLDDLRDAAVGQALKVRGAQYPVSPFDFIFTTALWERPRRFVQRVEFLEWMSDWFACSRLNPVLFRVSETYRQRCYLDRGEWPPFGYFRRMADWLRAATDLERGLAMKLAHLQPSFDQLVAAIADIT